VIRLTIQGGTMYASPEAYKTFMDFMLADGVEVTLNACEVLPEPDEPVVAEIVDATGDVVELLDEPPF
jgi:hypothetical protein